LQNSSKKYFLHFTNKPLVAFHEAVQNINGCKTPSNKKNLSFGHHKNHADYYKKRVLISRSAKVVMRAAPIRLRANPARDIVGMVTHPLPNTMALGGVATGNINANDAESVAGSISVNG